MAKDILAEGNKNSAVVLALSGDLGAGKTTFLQGFARGLGIKEVVNSPTFIVMKRFKIYDLRFKNFYHIDCYRLESEKDLEGLGFKEIISNPKNIVAIEWPEKIYPVEFGKAKILTKGQNYSTGVSEILPKGIISITFKHSGKTSRQIDIRQKK